MLMTGTVACSASSPTSASGPVRMPIAADVAREHDRRVTNRLTARELCVLRAQHHRVATELDDPGLERDAGAGRVTLEDQRDRETVQGAAAERRGLQLGGSLEQPGQLGRGELLAREEVLGPLCQARECTASVSDPTRYWQHISSDGGVASVPLHRNREFILLWSGEALSALGSQISLVAFPLLVLAVTGSPAKAGVVGFARNLPIALLALPAGVLADRLNRKYLMVACDGLRASALALIPIAIATGDVPFTLIVFVALIDGTGFVFTYVTERAAMRQLVPPDQLGWFARRFARAVPSGADPDLILSRMAWATRRGCDA